jgi:hypothetical protein
LSGRFRQRQTHLVRQRHGQPAANGRNRPPPIAGLQILCFDPLGQANLMDTPTGHFGPFVERHLTLDAFLRLLQ